MQPANLYLLILFYLSSSVQGHTALRHNAGGNPALRRLAVLPPGEALLISQGQENTHQTATHATAGVKVNQQARMTNVSRPQYGVSSWPPPNAPGRNTMKTNNALHHTTNMKASGHRPPASPLKAHNIKNSHPETSLIAPKVTYTPEQYLAIDEVLRRREMTEKATKELQSLTAWNSPEGNFASGKLIEAGYNEREAWRNAEMLGIKHPEQYPHWKDGDSSRNRQRIENAADGWLMPTDLSNYDLKDGFGQVLGLSGHDVFLEMNKAFETTRAETKSRRKAIKAAEKVNQTLKETNAEKVETGNFSGRENFRNQRYRLAQLDDLALAVRKMTPEMFQELELKSAGEAHKYALEFRDARLKTSGAEAPELMFSKKAKKK